ncbi:MAG: hypothetical protein ABI298_03610 [Acidimicrobiales bacterium]
MVMHLSHSTSSISAEGLGLSGNGAETVYPIRRHKDQKSMARLTNFAIWRGDQLVQSLSGGPRTTSRASL